MGLDIQIETNNSEELHSGDYHDPKNDYFHQHSLSRTFCKFMCRQNVISHEPELSQIAKITGVDMSPIYEMESYTDEEDLTIFLNGVNSEEGIKKIKEANAKISGNIDRVLKTINDLLEKLNSIHNLSDLLLETDYDTIGIANYFADFQIDKGEGYMGNNFGHDLRNFKRFLEFAKERGTTTVWFRYG
ncbi:MAG: hypothetical protein NT150_00595 [Bacteroidetes bacterium]|nr:hypothetical protein [Bacteroidota bacterium]